MTTTKLPASYRPQQVRPERLGLRIDEGRGTVPGEPLMAGLRHPFQGLVSEDTAFVGQGLRPIKQLRCPADQDPGQWGQVGWGNERDNLVVSFLLDQRSLELDVALESIEGAEP